MVYCFEMLSLSSRYLTLTFAVVDTLAPHLHLPGMSSRIGASVPESPCLGDEGGKGS